MTHPNQLAAKVAARNKAHAYAREIYPILAEYFRPFVGQKILKADGTLLKKIADGLPVLPDSSHLHQVYQTTGHGYSLSWVIRACESFKDDSRGYQSCDYYDRYCYVGDLRDGVLKAISNPPEYRTDYTEEEVLSKREAYRAAKKAFDEAQSALGDFGEYDR